MAAGSADWTSRIRSEDLRRLRRQRWSSSWLLMLGFFVLTVTMMVSGGADVTVPSSAIILVVFVAAGVWVGWLMDREDAASQARVGPGILSTPAAWQSLGGEGGARNGELQITSESVAWIPGRRSDSKPFMAALSETGGVALMTWGVLGKRGTLLVITANGLQEFRTAARHARLTKGLGLLGVDLTAPDKS